MTRTQADAMLTERFGEPLQAQTQLLEQFIREAVSRKVPPPEPVASLKMGDVITDDVITDANGTTVTINRIKGANRHEEAFFQWRNNEHSYLKHVALEGSSRDSHFVLKQVDPNTSEIWVNNWKSKTLRFNSGMVPKSAVIMTNEPHSHDPGGKPTTSRGYYLGTAIWWQMEIRTEELDASKRSGYATIIYVEEDPSIVMDSFIKSERARGGDDAQPVILLNTAQVTKAQAKAPLADPKKVKAFNKSELICYVVAVNGPMGKDEILQAVARIQDAPYTRGSNGSYFDPTRGMPSLGQLTIMKDGTKNAYYVGGAGMALATPVIKALGKGPAKKALKA